MEIAQEEVDVWEGLVRASGDGARCEIRDCVVDCSHGYEFSGHHPSAMVAVRGLSKCYQG